ncbi:YdbH domain-containing protein [Novosphingobium colocasiae]|uniref:YdbH domain-containing protein n=1 Tax=Novosphingobium colocasiae TaxID=1256513 RepID=UPI0035B1BB29
MAQDLDHPHAEIDPAPGGSGMSRRRRIALSVAGVLAVALAGTWLARKDIADNVIGGQLARMGLPAHYRIKSIGPAEQVLTGLVIGDPAHPDFTADEVRVRTRLFWGLPGIGRITLVRPRLYGSIRGGKPTFGSLDKVLFTGSKEPFEMPDLDVEVIDGRGLIDGDLGRIGIKLAGKGPLRDGFAGEVAAIAPTLALPGCSTGRTSLYGRVSITDRQPRFQGPLRLAEVACPGAGLKLATAGADIDATFDRTLDGGEGTLGLRTGRFTQDAAAFAQGEGTLHASYRKAALIARYDLTARDVRSAQIRARSLSLTGQARSAEGFSRLEAETDVRADRVALGDSIDTALAGAARSGQGTLLEPVVSQIRQALKRESLGSSLAMNLIARRSARGLSLVVPRADLRGGSGRTLLAVSRLQATVAPGARVARVTGNFVTGGVGLPHLAGRMESNGRSGLTLNATMAEYRAGSSRVAVPRLVVAQGRNGVFGFAGSARLSGALPGGWAEDLAIPLDGALAGNGNVRVWTRCTPVSFSRLELASVRLDSRALSICPAAGRAIVERRGGVLSIAAGSTGLDLSGHLGETPIRIASGPIGFAMPGAISARKLQISLGPAGSASRFAISHLDARVGKDVAGTFDDADIALFAVPLDLHQTAGNWRYAGGVLEIDRARFTLVDREAQPRFQPLIARDATLRLADNRIVADALLREPKSDRAVVTAAIRHDLGNARGSADLDVPGLVFDRQMQAGELSALALGVVSDLKGTVSGTGRIDWNERGVTSRGRFGTQGLDFAAAFGPVQGLSGDVVFTDLLGMVTAPDQKLKIAAMNPGVEVANGVLSFEMKPDHYLQINGARWPFMDGVLTLEPAHMRLGVAETRNYTLKVDGLDAQTFVQHLDLANIRATGVFDGRLPLVFDENGGRIDNGFLRSREPGGNVSYIGALTYKDLSAMGNFAFNALRSVNYRQMEIGLGGSLSGEIFTRISFDGLSQGTGASRNFLTKQVAKLPIRFILNIKAPFFGLFGSMRALYDPAYITDPRLLGLVGKDGRVPVVLPNASGIQPPVSGNTP